MMDESAFFSKKFKILANFPSVLILSGLTSVAVERQERFARHHGVLRDQRLTLRGLEALHVRVRQKMPAGG